MMDADKAYRVVLCTYPDGSGHPRELNHQEGIT